MDIDGKLTENCDFLYQTCI